MTVAVRNDLDRTFEVARENGRAVLIPYLTAGFPDPDGFVELAVAILEAGADMLEIGVPFSDPLLDGPAIQRSQQAALDAGITPPDCMRYAAEIHTHTEKPLLFMGAFNPIFAFGQERFCADARVAGISAIIVPDLPFEEQDALSSATRENGLHLIQMVAPTSTPERMSHICAAASGFIYCISMAGVTGARTHVAEAARPLVERARACSSVPVAVGFGIAGPEAAREVGRIADGVIVGTALINLLADAPAKERIERARDFITSLRDALIDAA